MNIVLVGMYFPMAILRYIELALRRRTDINLFTAGPFTGQQIPWNGGMWLKEYPDVITKPDMELSLQSPRAPITYVESRLPWEADLWIQVDAGFSLIGHPVHGKNFIVGTDPHVFSYNDERRYADKFFCMQTPYMKPNDIWLPYAYDPTFHTPLATQHQYDAGLIGAIGGGAYDNRQRLVNALRAAGLSVLAPGFGPVWWEYRELISQCKVGLNWSSQTDLCARVFEIMAMNLCPLINRVPDLAKMGFRDGVDYLGFDTIEEALFLLKDALASDKWETISNSAHEVVKPHTWDARVETLISHANN
jgi:hypothetical protein